MKEGLGMPQKMILNIDLRNRFQDEYWSICSWDFNGVSISTLWQESRYPFIQSSSPYWLICIIRRKELGNTEMNKTHHCPLGVCSKLMTYNINSREYEQSALGTPKVVTAFGSGHQGKLQRGVCTWAVSWRLSRIGQVKNGRKVWTGILHRSSLAEGTKWWEILPGSKEWYDINNVLRQMSS